MDGTMGVSEVLLAEALSNIVFSVFAGSPLLILRVTGRAKAMEYPVIPTVPLSDCR
jgi:hypothetical protein